MSPFRDSGHIFNRYREQIRLLDWPEDCLRLVVVEGDSADGTWQWLGQWAIADKRVRAVKCDLGARRYGSVIDAERFRILATVFNKGLDAVDLKWSDYVLFIPSDIVYQEDLAWRLVEHDVDIVAPMVYQNGRFYDLWAFQRDGKALPPFREEEISHEQDLWEMDTVGCVMLSRAEVLRAGVRYTFNDVDRGYCRDARSRGFGVYADPATAVYHGVAQ